MTREELLTRLMSIDRQIGTRSWITAGGDLGEIMDELREEINHEPSLPDDLDEMAFKYANKEYPDEAAVGQWGTGDYESPVDMEYPREIAEAAFKAGAEWVIQQLKGE